MYLNRTLERINQLEDKFRFEQLGTNLCQFQESQRLSQQQEQELPNNDIAAAVYEYVYPVNKIVLFFSYFRLFQSTRSRKFWEQAGIYISASMVVASAQR